jgi:chromosome segregation ATPase
MPHLKLVFLRTCFFIILIYGTGFAEELSLNEKYLENVQRLARLEEGQKAIIARFEAVDKRFDSLIREMNQRFEAVDKRFEAVDKRFEAVDKRFEAVDKQFESLIREMNQRFEALNKRIDLIENHVSRLDNYFLTILAAIIGLIAYTIWDRKTAFDAVYKKIEQLFQDHIEQLHYSQPISSQVTYENNSDADLSNETSSTRYQNNAMTIPRNIQEQFQNVVHFMNQFPETRQGGMATA